MPVPQAVPILDPQHLTVPVLRMMQTCSDPRAICTTIPPVFATLEGVDTADGVGFPEASVVPVPIWAAALSPQHFMVPSEKSTHVNMLPADIWEIFFPPRDTTSVGVALSTNVPSPICPFEFDPQHFTLALLVMRTQVCCQPTATCTTEDAENGGTGTGIG